jgi:outer membrane protein assembly factor BamB
MDEVQLDEAAWGGAVPERDGTAARRSHVVRLVRRWWPLPAAVLLALVAWQSVVDGRERAAAELLRETPGVLASTVSPPLEVTPWGSPDTTGVMTAMTAPRDGLIVAADEGGDGDPRSVVGVDVTNGSERWRVAVPTDDVTGSEPAGATCGDADGSLAWCSFTDVPTSGEVTSEAAASLVLVDVATGTVRPTPSLPPASSVVVAGDVAVTVSRVGESVAVAATSLSTGETRWRVDLADPAGRLVGAAPPWVALQGDRVLVTGATASWLLHPADGRVVATGRDVRLLRGDELVAVEGTVTRLLGTEGRGTATADGTPALVEPDDGTAPGVVLLTRLDGNTDALLRAVDAANGDVLWERRTDVAAVTQVVLLDGVLYGAGRSGLWAVDAVTGEEVWSTSSSGIPAGHRLSTDGVSLLRTERDSGRASGIVLSAYDLRDGGRRWTEPLPEEIADVQDVNGVLLGYGLGQTYVVQ